MNVRARLYLSGPAMIKGLDSVNDRVEIVRVNLLSYISYYVKYTRLDPKNQSTKKT